MLPFDAKSQAVAAPPATEVLLVVGVHVPTVYVLNFPSFPQLNNKVESSLKSIWATLEPCPVFKV